MGTTSFVEVGDRLNGIIVITFINPSVARSEGETIQEITKARKVGRGRFGKRPNTADKFTSRLKSGNIAIDSAQNGKAHTRFATDGADFLGEHFPPSIMVVNLAPTIWGMGRNRVEVYVFTTDPDNDEAIIGGHNGDIFSTYELFTIVDASKGN